MKASILWRWAFAKVLLFVPCQRFAVDTWLGALEGSAQALTSSTAFHPLMLQLPETGRPLDMMSQFELRKGGLVHAYFWHVLLMTRLGVVPK